MIYLYGLYEGQHDDLTTALEGSRGLQGVPEISAIGPWFLVYSQHDDQEVLPKRRLLLTHTQVLERMIAVGTVLPARFGLVADDLPAATALIQVQSDLVAEEFDRVRGHVELGVRIAFDREAALDATLAEHAPLRAERDALTGKGPEAQFAIAEFGGRLADQLDRRRGAAQRVLLDALVPLARDHVLRKPEDDTEVLRAEFLLSEGAQADFVAAIEDVASRLDFAPGADAAIQIVGPVPMYNFVRLSLTSERDGVAA
ncbi:MAG: GvpL/GvpF family gas vesicle protein [Pseudomonadota bacterium]